MSGDDLKSAEKRAADAAMEKENMRVAMTATEQKAISTTYVASTTPKASSYSASCERKDLIPHPRLRCEQGAVWGLSCVRPLSINLLDMLTFLLACNAANAKSSRLHTHRRKPAPLMNL